MEDSDHCELVILCLIYPYSSWHCALEVSGSILSSYEQWIFLVVHLPLI